MEHLTPGLMVLLESPGLIGDRRWALLANHAAVTTALTPARAALAAELRGPLVRLFAPEHGLEGVAQDMETVADEVDELTGVAVRSLYGHDAATLRPQAEDLAGVDVMVIDVPDIGSRYYTFAATMDAVMAACAEAAIEVVVLDRPNPITGVHREGGLVRPGCESFVSQLPTPVRHGLTLGEIAVLLQRERYPGLSLEVVLCRGWERRLWWDETGLPWVPPSPNMPTLETAAIYPGLCLVEATELSEGRGTTRPFHLVGAPWADGGRIVQRLRHLDLPGVAFRAATFQPTFSKWSGERCHGVEIHVTDREDLRSLELGLWIVNSFRELYPEHFRWRRDPYEFVAAVPAIDLLTGSSAARRAIDAGGGLPAVLEAWRWELRDFEQTLDGILLYT